MVKENGVYMQTRWVETQVHREKEAKILTVHMRRMEAELDNTFGEGWRQKEWKDMGTRMLSLVRKHNDIAESVKLLELAKKDPKTRKPPPLSANVSAFGNSSHRY